MTSRKSVVGPGPAFSFLSSTPFPVCVLYKVGLSRVPSCIYGLFHIGELWHSFLPGTVQLSVSRCNFSSDAQVRVCDGVLSTSARKPLWCPRHLPVTIPRTKPLALPTAPGCCISLPLNNTTVTSGQAFSLPWCPSLLPKLQTTSPDCLANRPPAAWCPNLFPEMEPKAQGRLASSYT